tara:strand:- start:673 stop:801 length:129 start_codon:yes stop_codon:yes gene_type:complete
MAKYTDNMIKSDAIGAPVGGAVDVDNVRRNLLKDKDAKVRKK